MIRVFIVAQSPEARADLAEQLKKRKVKVVGSAAGLDSAATASEAQAGIILIDAARADFKDLVRELEDQEVASEFAVVVLADAPNASEIARALRAGVRAVLPTDISPPLLISTLEAAAAGLVVLQPEATNQLLPVASATAPSPDMIEALTPREHQVLQMLASGLANKEIAAQLAISEHTAKFHVAAILGKLGAESRTEAVAIGIRRGLVLL